MPSKFNETSKGEVRGAGSYPEAFPEFENILRLVRFFLEVSTFGWLVSLVEVTFKQNYLSEPILQTPITFSAEWFNALLNQ